MVLGAALFIDKPRLEHRKQRGQHGQAYKGVGEHRQGYEQAEIA